MPRLRPCANSKHVYKATKDIRYEKCEVCKDVFPCKGKCEHLDCCYVRGDEPPPYWTALLAAMSISFETAGLVKWSDRHDPDQTRRRPKRDVPKLRREGSDRSGGPVEELESNDSLVRELSNAGGEVTFSASALEESLED